MQKCLLLIGTTQGPVQVLAVRKEHGDPPSALFLNGTTTRLSISRAYRDFVETPSGVIERIIGHRSFRTDVSAPIDSGDSWRLGVLIAHLLADDGALAGRTAHYDRVIWCSGKIEHIPGTDFDIEVGKIDHLAEKLSLSHPILKEAASRRIPVTFVLPGPNLTPEIKARIEELSPGASTKTYDAIDLNAFVEDWRVAEPTQSQPPAAIISDSPEPPPAAPSPPPEPVDPSGHAATAQDTAKNIEPTKSQAKWFVAALGMVVIGAGALAASQLPNMPWSTATATLPSTPTMAANNLLSDASATTTPPELPDPVEKPADNMAGDVPDTALIVPAAPTGPPETVDPDIAGPMVEPEDPAPAQTVQAPPAPWTASLTLQATVYYTRKGGNCLDSSNVQKLDEKLDASALAPLSVSGQICRGRLTVSNAGKETVRAILERSEGAPSQRLTIGAGETSYILLQSSDADASLILEAPGTDHPPLSFALFATPPQE